jgi:hypothetical protein
MPFTSDVTVGHEPAFQDASREHGIVPKGFLGIDPDGLHVQSPSMTEHLTALPPALCGSAN